MQEMFYFVVETMVLSALPVKAQRKMKGHCHETWRCT